MEGKIRPLAEKKHNAASQKMNTVNYQAFKNGISLWFLPNFHLLLLILQNILASLLQTQRP